MAVDGASCLCRTISLKSGELALPHLERLDQIAPFIAKIRISKGISQTELAGRLGVSKQVISRYEENDYQTVAIARLQEILDAIWDQDSGDSGRVNRIRPSQQCGGLASTSEGAF